MLPWTWIIKAILSMIICTSVIFCSHGFSFFFLFAINSTTTSNNISWSAWKKNKKGKKINAGPVNWAVGYSSLFLVTEFKQSVCHLFLTQRIKKNNTTLGGTGGPGHCNQHLGLCLACNSWSLGFQGEKKTCCPSPRVCTSPDKSRLWDDYTELFLLWCSHTVPWSSAKWGEME